jgi:hypothetical protein
MSHTWPIVSTGPPTQHTSIPYNGSNERPLSVSRSSRTNPCSFRARNPPMRRSQQLQFRQNLRNASSTTYQSSGYGINERDANLGIENGCSRGSIRSFCDKRISRNQRSGDEEAARQVERRFAKRRNDQLTGRIFRNLVSRRDELDDSSLHDLLLAADKTIFGGRLSGRVRWEWSNGQPEYEHELLGTTALRPATIGGWETLIVLSKPLLQDKRFSRDLLLSAFLHELVHCYLFIHCGVEHAKDDGHTKGFRTIADLIDRYFGQKRLHLCNMRANLDYFLVDDDEGYYSRSPSPGSPECHSVVEMGSGVETHCIQFTEAH